MLGRKVVAIPVGAVTRVSQDGIQLNITRQQVKDLPSSWHRSPGYEAESRSVSLTATMTATTAAVNALRLP